VSRVEQAKVNIVHHRTAHEGPEGGGERCSSPFPLTSTLGRGVDCQRYAPAALPQGKAHGTHCTGGWVGPQPVWTGAGNFAPPPQIRSPAHPVRRQSPSGPTQVNDRERQESDRYFNVQLGRGGGIERPEFFRNLESFARSPLLLEYYENREGRMPKIGGSRIQVVRAERTACSSNGMFRNNRTKVLTVYFCSILPDIRESFALVRVSEASPTCTYF